MARPGTFGEDQTPLGWFGEDTRALGWLDDDLLSAETAAPSMSAASGSYAMVGFAIALKKTSLVLAASGSFALSGGGGGAAWDKGFNFRGSSGYVTDDANETYVIGDAYPTTRNGVTFGWSVNQGDVSWADRNASVDRRLAGINYRLNNGTQSTFRVDLPGTGDYTVRLALGDYSSAQNYQYVTIRDGAATLFTVDDPDGTANDHWDDASGVDRTGAAWPGSNVAVGATLTGTVLNIVFASPVAQAGSSTLSHIFVSRVGGASWTNLKVGRKVQAAQGSFALSGQDATLTYDTGPAFIAAGQGTYTETGVAASLRVARRMVASPAASAADIASADFNDGTPGDFDFLGTPGPVDYPDDPTGSGRGKVNRILYSPGAGLASHDVSMEKTTAYHYRYGERLWFRGEVYIPSTISDGVTTKTAQQDDNTRKLVDYFTGGSPHTRLIIATHADYQLHYSIAQLEAGVWAIDVRDDPIPGLFLTPDTWNKIEIMLLPNSADGVADGVLEVYLNNPGAVPDFRLDTGLSMISDGVNGGTTDEQALFDLGGSYFNSFRFGTQLTTDAGQAAYSEYRYWDNVGVSTTRIGVGFNLYGQSVGLRTGKRLAAAQGAYTETGQPAALKAARTLTLANGSFTETGQAATLRSGRKLPAGFGSYVETGQDANLLRGGNPVLIGATGSFTQTGIAANLRAARIVTALPASFTHTGIAANLRHAVKAIGSTGMFVESGQDARLAATHRVTALQGTYTETGQAVQLFVAKRITALFGDYVLTGPTTGLIYFSQTGTTAFTGEISISPRFTGIVLITPRFSGQASLASRFDGEMEVRPA